MREFFKKLKQGTESENYGRHILRKWGSENLVRFWKNDAARILKVLDLGCGHGSDLLNIQSDSRRLSAEVRMKLFGVENYPPYIKECRQSGIETSAINIEKDRFPGNDASFDIILANQILEHTKEIFWITAEAARILRPGGLFLVGVPNLASFHNRLLLFFGEQPTAQQSFSAHVRTFTKPDFKRFAETGGYFQLKDVKGSNFYPFGLSISRPLSRIFPTFAWGIFFLLERTQKKGSFLECLSGDENFLETPFYGSPQNPARRQKK